MRYTLPILFLFLMTTVLAGCGERPKRAAKVEPDKARATLTQALDAWKAGKLQPLLERAGIAYKTSKAADPYSFLPGWLHPR